MSETIPTIQERQTLEENLFAQPYRFDFFQAVRLLERIYEERRPVGQDTDATREIVRFRTPVNLAFPASQISILKREEETEQEPNAARMTVAFMGLTGPSGVLPHPYSELLMERLRNKDTALHEFFDLFNHRVISLFYRAWEKYRFPIAFERGSEDHFTEFLFDLAGMGTRGLRNRFSFKDEGLLSYAGLIANKPHSASVINGILSDYFGVPAQLEQFKGQWLQLEEESYSRLGTANHELGIRTVVGTRVWDSQSKIRVRFGPVKFNQFVAFLPNGSAYNPATELIRFLIGQEFDFDLQLIIRKQTVPACRLKPSAQPLLGWTTWLKTKEFLHDDEQVILASNRLN